jgi:hypothetical protein
MKPINTAAGRGDEKISVKIKLSALWVTMMLLYIYADILSLYRPGQVEEMMDGRMGPLPATQASLLAAAILMTIPAVMVFLTLALKSQVSRWANLTTGVFYILVNIGNLIGETWAYYLFFGMVELVLTLLIVGYAWTWFKQEEWVQQPGGVRL